MAVWLRSTDTTDTYQVREDEITAFRSRVRRLGLVIEMSSPVCGGYQVTVAPKVVDDEVSIRTSVQTHTS